MKVWNPRTPTSVCSADERSSLVRCETSCLIERRHYPKVVGDRFVQEPSKQ
jgi:hypothetical protein